MTTMQRIFLAAVIALLGCQSLYAQTGVAVPEMTVIDDAVNAFMTKWGVPGGSVAITYQGRLVYARGFGMADVGASTPVEPWHVFRIASLSKSITGIAATKLIEDGLLNESDLVFGPTGILNGVRYDTLLDARMQDITVGDLLHHTAGISVLSNGFDPVFADHYIQAQTGLAQPYDSETKIEYYLTTQSLARAPGTSFEYSNLGFSILGRVIESVSGNTYQKYVEESILMPLGIETMRMGSSLEEDAFENEVRYYDYPGAPLVTSVYGNGKEVARPYGMFNLDSFDSLGGWTASATDLVRLLVAIDGFSTKPDILAPESIEKMTTTTPQSAGYALGWVVNNVNNWWHFGSLPGATSEWVRTNTGLAWALQFNFRPANNLTDAYLSEMDALIWNALPGISSWPAHDLFTVSTANERNEQPEGATVIELYPNPALSHSRVVMHVAEPGHVRLSVFDILGREITSLEAGIVPAGSRTYEVDLTALPAGVYFVRAHTSASTDVQILTVSH